MEEFMIRTNFKKSKTNKEQNYLAEDMCLRMGLGVRNSNEKG